MRSNVVKFARFLLILHLSIILFGCSAAKSGANPNLIWTVGLSKFEVKNKLEAIETVAQYNGSYDQLHQQSPAAGNVYVIMKLTISKQGADPVPFDWSQLSVRDSAGKTYQRSSNDTFLEQYKYTPRMTGLEIKLGVNEGWLCYEIPKQAADGKLSLIYTAQGSQQEIALK